MPHNVRGLLLCWDFIMSSPQLKPNKITDDEDKNKSRLGLRLQKPLLIANKKMRIYSSAGIAAPPMLAFRAFRREVIAHISPLFCI
jgi:hypothetical protein